MPKKRSLKSFNSRLSGHTIDRTDISLGARSITCFFSSGYNQKLVNTVRDILSFPYWSHKQNTMFDSFGYEKSINAEKGVKFLASTGCTNTIYIDPIYFACPSLSATVVSDYIRNAVERFANKLSNCYYESGLFIIDSLRFFKGPQLSEFLLLLHNLRKKYKVAFAIIADSYQRPFRNAFDYHAIKDFKRIHPFVDSYIAVTPTQWKGVYNEWCGIHIDPTFRIGYHRSCVFTIRRGHWTYDNASIYDSNNRSDLIQYAYFRFPKDKIPIVP